MPRSAELRAIEGVLDLMDKAGTLDMLPDTIVPYGNGYGCWFIAHGQHGTKPLTAEEILQRVEGRRKDA